MIRELVIQNKTASVQMTPDQREANDASLVNGHAIPVARYKDVVLVLAMKTSFATAPMAAK